MEGGEFYFVQARPITALPEAPNEDGPLVVWDNSNIQESHCGVTTPMTFTYAQRGYLSAYRQTMEARILFKEEIQPQPLPETCSASSAVASITISTTGKGLTPSSFGQNKEDMEEMMGLKDPVDFVEDDNLSSLEKLHVYLDYSQPFIKKGFRNLKTTVPIFQDNFEKHASKLSIDKIKEESPGA